MRILICSNAYPPRFVGGAELMAHEQAKALAHLGHDVRVFAGEPDADRARHTRSDDLHEGIRVHRVALEPEDYSPEFLNFLHPLVDDHFRDVLDDFAPDIVHCHNLLGLSAKLPLLARLQGAKTICTLHDFWGFCLRNSAVRIDGRPCDNTTQFRTCLPRIHDGRRLHVPMRLRKDFLDLALDQIDRFIVPSRFVAQRYARAGWSSECLEVIPNGIDLDRFHPAGAPPHLAGPVRITYAGYFGAHKGVTTLLDAFATLPAPLSDAPALLQLAGEGPERDAYAVRIEKLGLKGRVRFLGKIAPGDMSDVYARSDIVVLPSIWDENQPVCLMEAMAAGLPVIASRKGGIPELVEHGVNGLLFAAGDVADLGAQLAALVADADLRRRAGREGRRRVEHLGHDRQAHLLVALYAEIAAARPGRAPRPAVLRREVYAAIGSLRRKMTGEGVSLADAQHRTRHFMPREWIAECRPAIRGVLLTGRSWCALRLLKIDAVVPLPRIVARWMRPRPLPPRPLPFTTPPPTE
ncbi:MAG: glycosyltransferase family 4 protein [Novosphingobium sp.]|nr:glycosyltransferase family 4 protein [Novosphingobium sp.]